MNKYKMISICSLTIACVLMLSILLPNRANANDKESLELNMHYENSQVTANITVNSDVYTGVICKYIMIDDVYKSDDLLAQTRDNGTTINLDKSENDKYETIIQNVTKRYVVIYVSIGNCSLCDYIDCQQGKVNDNNSSQTENKSDEEHKISVEGEGTNGQKVEATTDNNQEEPKKEENKTEQNKEDKTESSQIQNKEDDKQEQSSDQNKDENKHEQQTNSNSQEGTNIENKTDKPIESNNQTNNSQNKEDQKIVVDNKTETSSDFQTIEDSKNNSLNNNTNQSNNKNSNSNSQIDSSKQSNTNVSNKDSIDVTTQNKNKDSIDATTQNKNKDTITVNSNNKDSIDISDFQEIEKTVSTSTADGNMPQTGENDFVVIMGIIVFSFISVISFYKYKTTK